MIELYQFELSHYCEKVRLILDYKGLTYRKVEVTPGVGQIDLYRMSGQRQVPVLKDGTEIIGDSTAIAKYLERKYPDRPILPTDPKEKAVCWILEEWADASIGLNSRKVMLDAFSHNRDLRTAVLPPSTPDFLKTMVGAVPNELLDLLGYGVGMGPDTVKASREIMQQNLESLTTLLMDKPYLVADHPTVADFAVAGLSMYLKFPTGSYVDLPVNLKGKGVPGLADNIAYSTFWDWRDRLYSDFRKPAIGVGVGSNSTAGGPTSINID